MLYVLVCGKVPFDDQSMPALHAKIKRGLVEYPVWLSAGVSFSYFVDLWTNRSITECKHLLSRMLVTNPASRASLPEVLTHPWMLRGFKGPADSHLVHREPLRADELDRQVIKGMKGFEFGSEEFIEKKLIKVLESDSYIRAVQNWERKRDGYGYGGRNGVSNSSLSISLEGHGHPPVSSSGGAGATKSKSRRFSGFDFYRRKLFSSPSSPPSSPLSGNSPPSSQNHLSTLSLGDANREPTDPTRGFHPLISMYYLAREKMERERVYGPGHFASSQLSIQENEAAAAEPTPNDTNGTFAGPPKVDYGMALPHLPTPETIHQSGMSYNATPATPSPTTPGFGQPRARDSGLPVVNKNDEVPPSATLPSNGTTATSAPKAGLPRAPPASTHRRSHSLSQRPTVLGNRWGLFGEKEAVDEHGSLTNEIKGPPHTAGPEMTTFTDKTQESRPSNDGSLNAGAGATLARKFGSLLGGRGDGSGRHSVNKRATILGGLSPRPSGESDSEKKKSSEQPASGKTSPVLLSSEKAKEKEEETGRKTPTPKSISHSQSQPLSTVHRRAATILDISGRNTRHERRSSTGGALLTLPGGGTIGRHRRPSTGYGTSTRPSGGLFGKTQEVEEVMEVEEGVEGANGNRNGKAENFGEEGERHTSEKDFKPVFLKGLFR